MSEKKELGKEAKRNLMIIGGIMIAAIIFSVWFIANVKQKTELTEAIKSKAPEINQRREDRASGESPINSEQLAYLNKDRDTQAAEEAKRKGETYIPELIDSPKEEIKKEKTTTEQHESFSPTYDATGTQQPALPQTTNIPAEANNMASILIDQILKDSRPVPSISGTTAKLENTPFSQNFLGQQVSPKDEKSSSFVCPFGYECNDKGEVLLKRAGDTLFVELELSINTDVVSPVFGKIISGHPELRGKQIIGSFRQNPDLSVSIVFNKIAMKNGTIPMNGIVVDVENGRAALNGKVDHKWLERFGLPMLSSAAGKYAELVSQQGTSVVTGIGTTVQTSTLSNQQIRNAAIGEGIKRIGSTFDATAAAAKPSTELPNHIGVQVRLLDDLWGKL